MKRALIGLALVCVGCASTARLTGNFGDYAAYRRTRLAPTLEQRLGAAERYLRAFPEGDYHEEVRSWFLRTEKHYFKLSWNNLPRLRAYLDAMPHGPHAEAVTDRITELESRRIFEDRRDQRMLEHAQGIEDRLAEAASQRRGFLHEVTALTRALGATRSFGEPTSELDSELLLRFRVRQPPGSCQRDRCAKTFSFSYAVPQSGGLTDRAVEVRLEIALDRGLVRKVTVSGSELLTRVAEAAVVRAVPSDNPQAHAEALAQALDVLEGALEGVLPKARCGVDVVSPVVLARRCDGVSLQVIAGLESGAPDTVQISSATAETR